MSTGFPYTCPYCNRSTTITDSNYSDDIHYLDKDNKQGMIGLKTVVIICPNPNCKEISIEAKLYKAKSNYYDVPTVIGDPLINWSLKPNSKSKVFPNYIPEAILSDYEEACKIVNLSPKASATLSRRCLQGIIRDFWEIKPGRLVDEIKAIERNVDPTTWEAIDAIRSIGNIGAHMEKDINLIIDVDPNEAELLIKLIEMLIKDWYITKFEREQQLKKIANIAESKAIQKKQIP